jgi:hypothetical protein
MSARCINSQTSDSRNSFATISAFTASRTLPPQPTIASSAAASSRSGSDVGWHVGGKAGARRNTWLPWCVDKLPFAFAGIWTEFKGDRGTKSKPIAGPHLVYGFLTTAPNAVVEPIQANRKSCWVSATWLCTTTSLPELNVIVLSWVVGSKAEMLS